MWWWLSTEILSLSLWKMSIEKPFQVEWRDTIKETPPSQLRTKCSRNDPDSERFLPFTTAWPVDFGAGAWQFQNMHLRPSKQINVWIVILNNISSFILLLLFSEYSWKAHLFKLDNWYILKSMEKSNR